MAFARGELDNTIDLRRTATDRSVDIEDDAELDERDAAAEEFQEPAKDEEEPAEDPAVEFFDCQDQVPPPPAAADASSEPPPELLEEDDGTDRRYDRWQEDRNEAAEPPLEEHGTPDAAWGLELLLGLDADERMPWLLAQPGADPPCRHGGFQPEDIWQGDMAFFAKALRDKFWRGTVFLATR